MRQIGSRGGMLALLALLAVLPSCAHRAHWANQIGWEELEFAGLPDQADYPDAARGSELWTSSLVVEGEAGGHTAMSRTVGLPVALAARLLLRDELPQTGSAIPTHPSIVDPILREVRAAGLEFVERRSSRETQEA